MKKTISILNATLLHIPSLGPVLFTPSNRAKHLSITIKPDQTIKVTIPKRVSLETAKKFLQSKIPWAKKNLSKLKKLQQNYPKQSLLPINKKEAKTVLTERLNFLAHKYIFSYNRLYIRNQKTRWGSCSSKSNISLNINLIRLPQELQDYVILHELVHTRHNMRISPVGFAFDTKKEVLQQAKKSAEDRGVIITYRIQYNMICLGNNVTLLS